MRLKKMVGVSMGSVIAKNRRTGPAPSIAAAFIEGAREQGADVVDYGMMGTDMLYFAVARDGHDGGAQITSDYLKRTADATERIAKAVEKKFNVTVVVDTF